MASILYSREVVAKIKGKKIRLADPSRLNPWMKTRKPFDLSSRPRRAVETNSRVIRKSESFSSKRFYQPA
jgi:hypothetical protein